MYLIVSLLLLCEILPSSELKTACLAKMEKITPTYVNHKLIDYDINATPYNETINILNQTIKFKFDVTENILLFNATYYRVTKSNRTYIISQRAVPFKDTIAMEQFGVAAMWRDYTRPPLYWPPRVNVSYRTFGWAPDSNVLICNLPSGKLKVLTTAQFPNRTEVYGTEWIFNIDYQ